MFRPCTRIHRVCEDTCMGRITYIQYYHLWHLTSNSVAIITGSCYKILACQFLSKNCGQSFGLNVPGKKNPAGKWQKCWLRARFKMSRPIRWLGVVLEPLLITIPSQDKRKVIEHFYQLFFSIHWLSQGKFSCRKIFHFREIGRLFKREKPAIKWLTSLFLSWLMKWSQSIICLFCAWFVCLFFSALGFVCLLIFWHRSIFVT